MTRGHRVIGSSGRLRRRASASLAGARSATAGNRATEARASELVEAEGHLIDSQLLTGIFDAVIRHGGSFEIQQFHIGRTNEEPSHLTMSVAAPTPEVLRELVEELVPLGCRVARERDAALEATDRDRCAPEGFYSTTNHRTFVRHEGQWLEVQRQRMDAAIVIEPPSPRPSPPPSGGEGARSAGEGARAICRKLRELRAGDRVVCGVDGVRVVPEFKERDRLGFAFMTNDISSERRVEASVGRIAAMMREVKAEGGRIAFVAGPVVVHTGGAEYFGDLIRAGYVDVLLAGNALAVHDVEHALYGTSLGIDLEAGTAVEGGHRHHMRAINTITRAGGLKAAVQAGVLTRGLMFQCITHNVPYVLAGSVRDDGPLPDTMMNLIEAQDRYAEALRDVRMVMVLGTMLHGIGVGNMLPSWVRMVCVDINPAVVTKLADRGSQQTIGLVTDVGLFLHHLARHLASTPVGR